MSFLVHTSKGRVAARAYCGMWIADCLRCKNAERLDRFQSGVMCSYCNIGIEIIWPAEDFVHSIERLLLMRPIPYTQNWNPGETLHDLLAENAEHGVFDPLKAIPQDPGQSLLVITDETIRRDLLPVTKRRDMQEVTG